MTNKSRITLKVLPVKGKGKPENDVILLLQGDLVLDHVQKVKDFFLENLAKYTTFTIKVNDVDNIDLGVIQLIQRFLWDALALEKKAAISLKLTDEQKALLSKAGFESFLLQSID